MSESDASVGNISVTGWLLSTLKKQQRDLKRLLSSSRAEKLPEAFVLSKRSLLDSITAEISRRQSGGERDLTAVAQPEPSAKKKSKKQQKRVAVDYKKVRFIEKTKVQKLLAGVQKQLRQVSHSLAHATEVNPPLSGDEVARLQSQHHELQAQADSFKLDLLYTLHFPKEEKYISLFPPSPYTSEAVLSRQSAIRQKILENHSLHSIKEKDPAQIHQQKRDARQQRKALVKTLTQPEADSIESDETVQSVSKRIPKDTKPVAPTSSNHQSIRRDEDSSDEDESSRRATSKDDFFLSHNDEVPTLHAKPSEYIADLRPVDKWDQGDQSDNTDGNLGRKRKRDDDTAAPQPKLRKRW